MERCPTASIMECISIFMFGSIDVWEAFGRFVPRTFQRSVRSASCRDWLQCSVSGSSPALRGWQWVSPSPVR